jgi:hypothetical protein
VQGNRGVGKPVVQGNRGVGQPVKQVGGHPSKQVDPNKKKDERR